MKRRDFIKASVAVPAIVAFPTGGFAQRAERYVQQKRLIDIHCHVFNLSDLPGEDFIQKVFLREKIRKLTQKHKWLAPIITEPKIHQVLATIVEEVREVAETPDIEVTMLDNNDKRDRLTLEKATLKKVLYHVWNPHEIIDRINEVEDRDVNERLINTIVSHIQYAIKRELNLSNIPDPDAPIIDPTEYTWISDLLFESDKAVGVMARWAVRFAVRRSENVDQLQALHGGRSRVALLTPALVDFSMWLTKPENLQVDSPTPWKVSSIKSQVDAMARIARRPDGPRVHCFVAYDPLYQAMAEKYAGRFPEKPFETVVDAVQSKGCIGIKLYPPMGFRPYKNTENNSFTPDVMSLKHGLGPKAGELIDAALVKLYQWCALNEVPILAHAQDSHGSFLDSSRRANPIHWPAVSQIDGVKNLKVCLAHFGGFEEWAMDYTLPHTKTWEWEVINIWRNHKTFQVYADLSYLEEVLDIPEAPYAEIVQRNVTREYMKKWLTHINRTFGTLASERLMFGSDWSMLGQEAGFLTSHHTQPSKPVEKTYFDRVDRFLFDATFSYKQRENIMFKNAARFLGLDSSTNPTSNRKRLETFYQKNKLPTDWLNEFGT